MQTAINLDLIIIGGWPLTLGKLLIDIIKESLKELDFIQETTKVLISITKNDAWIYDAILWAKNKGQ